MGCNWLGKENHSSGLFFPFPRMPSKSVTPLILRHRTPHSVLVLGVKIRVKSLSVLPIKHEANARGGGPLAHRLSDRSAYGRGIPPLPAPPRGGRGPAAASLEVERENKGLPPVFFH